MQQPDEIVTTPDPDCKLQWHRVNAGEVQTVCGRYAIASIGELHVIAILIERRTLILAGDLCTGQAACELHRRGASPLGASAGRQPLLGRPADA